MKNTILSLFTLMIATALITSCIQAAPFAGDVGDVAIEVTEPDGNSGGDGVTADATLPDAPGSDATDPDATDPDATDPDATDPDATDPDVTEPDGELPCPIDCTDKVCGDDGCGESCGECTTDTFCDETQQCIANVCTPKAPYCDGNVARTCNEEGSGFDPTITAVNCTATGEICEEGVCECKSDCFEKTCGDDGCGGSCGACEENQTCDEDGTLGEETLGTCVTHECTGGYAVCSPTSSVEVVQCQQNGFYPSAASVNANPDLTIHDCSDPQKGGWSGSVCTLPEQGASLSEAMGDLGEVQACSCNPEETWCDADGSSSCGPDDPCTIAVECKEQKKVSVDCADPDEASQSDLCGFGICKGFNGESPVCSDKGGPEPCEGDPCPQVDYGAECVGDTQMLQCEDSWWKLITCGTKCEDWIDDGLWDAWCEPTGQGDSCGQSCGADEICYGTGAGNGGEACQNCDDFCNEDWVDCGAYFEGNNGNGSCNCSCQGPDCIEGGVGDGVCEDAECFEPGAMMCWNSGIDTSFLRCTPSGGAYKWVAGDCQGGKVCDQTQEMCVDAETEPWCGWLNASPGMPASGAPDQCVGEPCTAPNLSICAGGGGSSANSTLTCVGTGVAGTWEKDNCDETLTCAANNTCMNHYGWFSSTCDTAGSVLCLANEPSILLCDFNGGDLVWKEVNGCPGDSVCFMDKCVDFDQSGGSDPEPGCLVEDSNMYLFCASAMGDCCQGDGCLMAGTVCANENGDDHTLLKCSGAGGNIEAITCEIGSICKTDGEWSDAYCGFAGSGGGNACGECNAEGSGALCQDNACVPCEQICQGLCGAVIGEGDQGSCDCGESCPENQECDHSINKCVQAECGNIEDLCTLATCGTIVDECDALQFCGAECAFGVCGDDYAVDVLQDPATEKIYVIGRQCNDDFDCSLRIQRLSGSGQFENEIVVSATNWFNESHITVPTAAALRSGKLVVVGSTRGIDTATRYGFVALFDVADASKEPQLLAKHLEDKMGVILDVAINGDGQPVVAGFLEPNGPGDPDMREPWAMRYTLAGGGLGGLAHNGAWDTNLGFTLDSGSCHNVKAEDKIVSVEILEGISNVYAFAGYTVDDSDAKVGCVIQLHSDSGAPIGVKTVPLQEGFSHVELHKMRLQPKVSGQSFLGVLVGSAMAVDEPGAMRKAFAQPLSFSSSSGANAVINFLGMEFGDVLDLDTVPGESAIHDACFTPDGTVVLVGEAQPHEDYQDVTPYVVGYTISGGKVLAQLPYEPVSVVEYAAVTDDRFRSCAPVVVASKGEHRMMMVGDIQEIQAGEASLNDTLMVDIKFDGSKYETYCSGLP